MPGRNFGCPRSSHSVNAATKEVFTMNLTRTSVWLGGVMVFAGALGVVQAQSKGEIQAMDRDGDTVVTRLEWRGSTGAFRLHDTNRDGVLSGLEVWEANDVRVR